MNEDRTMKGCSSCVTKGVYVLVLKRITNLYQLTLSHSSYVLPNEYNQSIKVKKKEKERKKETNQPKIKGMVGGTNALL